MENMNIDLICNTLQGQNCTIILGSRTVFIQFWNYCMFCLTKVATRQIILSKDLPANLFSYNGSPFSQKCEEKRWLEVNPCFLLHEKHQTSEWFLLFLQQKKTKYALYETRLSTVTRTKMYQMKYSVTRRHLSRMLNRPLTDTQCLIVCTCSGVRCTWIARSKLDKFYHVGGGGPCTFTTKLYKFKHVLDGGQGQGPVQWVGPCTGGDRAGALYREPPHTHTNRQTDPIENIMFPQLLWRTVKTTIVSFLTAENVKQTTIASVPHHFALFSERMERISEMFWLEN